MCVGRGTAPDLVTDDNAKTFSLEFDDSVKRAFNLIASCDMSSPQSEAILNFILFFDIIFVIFSACKFSF